MNENETIGLKSLLQGLSISEVNQLFNTVTKNLIKNVSSDKEETIDAIILHSPSAESVLNRKLITCSVLYEYLHKNSVSVFPPVTKSNLIDLVIAFWLSKNNEDYNSYKSTSASQSNVNNESQDAVHKIQQISKTEGSSNFPINVMARTFCEWFYKMFNEDKGLTCIHFWPDCSLRLSLKSNEETITQEVMNDAESVVHLLEETKSSHGLYFNPNISHEGVQGRMNPYGLTMIVACGTLHKEDLCVGIFQQMFALARDPQASNNWKIKNSELQLHNTSVTRAPSLLESDYTTSILSLPECDETI